MNRYGPKMKKTEKPDKAQIIIHFPHSVPRESIDLTKYDHIQVASIDPARKHYALRIEKWDMVSKTVTPIVFDKFCLVGKESETDDVVKYEDLYIKLTEVLSRYHEHFQNCHLLVCEKQPPLDYKTVRVSQHTVSYFIEHFKNSPLNPYIIEVDPKYRCKVLGAPKLTYDPLKAWMVEKAIDVLNQRGDKVSLSIINKTKKKDDLADTVCQIISIMIHFNLYFEPEPITEEIEYKGHNHKETKKRENYTSVRFRSLQKNNF